MENLGRRLKSLREQLGLDQDEFAKQIGAARPTVSRWERGLNFPPADALYQLAAKYSINIHWLVTGDGEQILGEPRQCISPGDLALVPLLESWVKAGPEGEILYEGIADHYPFKRWWLERLVGRSPERFKKLFLIRVRGDSMSPLISQGELVLVDTWEGERAEIRTGQIYLVVLPEGSVAIKRLALTERSGRIRLVCISDNTASYKPFEFDLAPNKSILEYVIGRVRWAGKEFD